MVLDINSLLLLFCLIKLSIDYLDSLGFNEGPVNGKANLVWSKALAKTIHSNIVTYIYS